MASVPVVLEPEVSSFSRRVFPCRPSPAGERYDDAGQVVLTAWDEQEQIMRHVSAYWQGAWSEKPPLALP